MSNSTSNADSTDRPRVLLLAGGDKPHIREGAVRLRPIIEKYVDVVLADFDNTSCLDEVEAEMAIVLGGDGSILRAAKQMGDHQRPVLGINFGKLGFLADIAPDEVEAVLAEVCKRNFHIVDHLMFRCQVLKGDQVLAETLGLNEMAILGGPPYTMIDIDLYVDGQWATTYSCDGLILATPVGSTAHNLSVGGPIVRKDCEVFVVSPINPHTLTVRPVVDTADRRYEVVVTRPNDVMSVVVDGRVLHSLSTEHCVRVERAKPTFQLVEVEGHSYYRTLREKLGWGGRIGVQSREPRVQN